MHRCSCARQSCHDVTDSLAPPATTALPLEPTGGALNAANPSIPSNRAPPVPIVAPNIRRLSASIAVVNIHFTSGLPPHSSLPVDSCSSLSNRSARFPNKSLLCLTSPFSIGCFHSHAL